MCNWISKRKGSVWVSKCLSTLWEPALCNACVWGRDSVVKTSCGGALTWGCGSFWCFPYYSIVGTFLPREMLDSLLPQKDFPLKMWIYKNVYPVRQLGKWGRVEGQVCSGISVSLGDFMEPRTYRMGGGAVLDINCILVPTLPESSFDGPSVAFHVPIPSHSLSLNLMEILWTWGWEERALLSGSQSSVPPLVMFWTWYRSEPAYFSRQCLHLLRLKTQSPAINAKTVTLTKTT